MEEDREQQEQQRVTPASELDFNMLVINPSYGTPEVSQDLRDKLSYVNIERDKDGQPVLTPDGAMAGNRISKWNELGFFTRDIRLGNITPEEVVVVRDRLRLAHSLMAANAPNAFALAYGEGVGMIETSMSVKGFLRRIWNTLRQENISSQPEPAKKTFFGGSGKTN